MLSATSGIPVRAPELEELETLLACATDGSFAAAAQRLGISRPAVSKRIANLEALAGRRLLNRSTSGVSLSDAGASMLASARRLLEERDRMFAVLTDLRTDGAPADGLSALFGDGAVAQRSAHLAETRLADSQRLLAMILGEIETAVAVSDLDTGVVLEANPAFCRFCGRPRDQLLGGRASTHEDWYTSAQRERLIDDVRRDGSVKGAITRLAAPDGAVRVGRSSVFLVSLAGRAVLLTLVEDVTDRYPAVPDADSEPPFPLER
jgi:PAS domain S-box-containing protein